MNFARVVSSSSCASGGCGGGGSGASPAESGERDVLEGALSAAISEFAAGPRHLPGSNPSAALASHMEQYFFRHPTIDIVVPALLFEGGVTPGPSVIPEEEGPPKGGSEIPVEKAPDFVINEVCCACYDDSGKLIRKKTVPCRTNQPAGEFVMNCCVTSSGPGEKCQSSEDGPCSEEEAPVKRCCVESLKVNCDRSPQTKQDVGGERYRCRYQIEAIYKNNEKCDCQLCLLQVRIQGHVRVKDPGKEWEPIRVDAPDSGRITLRDDVWDADWHAPDPDHPRNDQDPDPCRVYAIDFHGWSPTGGQIDQHIRAWVEVVDSRSGVVQAEARFETILHGDTPLFLAEQGVCLC